MASATQLSQEIFKSKPKAQMSFLPESPSLYKDGDNSGYAECNFFGSSWAPKYDLREG